MKLRIHPAAEEETAAAARWYDQNQEGLGLEFLQEINRTVQAIALSPERFSRLETLPDEGYVRRALVRRFPYAVIFESTTDCVHVMAIAHTRRRPDYWKSRR